ncbi:hypothetical protein ACQPZJ_47455 [Actinoplanes sp. CA-054009]
MTNWMTAAGIALIAGGIATLICFRSVLFRVGGRRAGRRAVREATRTAVLEAEAQGHRGRGSRRRSRIAAPDEDERGGLAMIGLAAEEDVETPEARPRRRRRRQDQIVYADEHTQAQDDALEPDPGHDREPDPDFEPEPARDVERGLEPGRMLARELGPDPDFAGEPEPGHDVERGLEPGHEFERGPEPEAGAEPVAGEAAPAPRSGGRLGHRVEGWVRPEYRQTRDELPSGEYWTPIPVELDADHEPSAKGYGWPLAVERLPPVPDYEPATGFDLAPVEMEPTQAVPTWPPGDDGERPGRIRLPRSWQSRNDKRRAAREQQPPAREWRPENESPPAEREGRPRPRPRPRPAEAAPPPSHPSRVYVSRHAADPPQCWHAVGPSRCR